MIGNDGFLAVALLPGRDVRAGSRGSVVAVARDSGQAIECVRMVEGSGVLLF